MPSRRLEDVEGQWLRQSLMIPRLRANQIDAGRQNQYAGYYNQLQGASRAKFTDTTIGGNFAINTPPQFCRYSDVRSTSRFRKNTPDIGGGNGMGRYYSEAIDDNAQLVHFRFGVPEFNSLTTFYTGFYNSEASLLARKGRATPLLYDLGKVVGTVVSIPLAPIIGVGAIWRWLAREPASKYYYLKPTMPLYWNAVNTIANSLAVNMGLYPKPYSQDEANQAAAAGLDPDTINLSEAEALRMHEALPDIFFKGGGVDVYAIANRATRLAHKYYEELARIGEKAVDNEDLQRQMREFLDQDITDPGAETYLDDGSRPAIDHALARWHGGPGGSEEAPNTNGSDTGRGAIENANSETGTWDSIVNWGKDLIDFGKAELADGSAFATFRVDHTATVTESFNNSVRDSDIAGTINSQSSTSRNARFSFADGNAVGGGLGGVVQSAISSARDVVQGVLDGVQMSGIFALAGSAFVDIPKHWDNSTANLPSMSYTIQLQAWSGDKFTRFTSLMIPLAMILAGALPRSTGTQSYTSPFICECYHKGRAQTRLGIIDSISITRGTGNVGWTRDHHPLGIDITFNVIDLSSILHMPIASNFSLNPFSDMFAEDTAFTDYMAVLGGLGLSDQIYIRKRFHLAMARKMISFRQWTSPARWANWANGTDLGRLANAISREIDRP